MSRSSVRIGSVAPIEVDEIGEFSYNIVDLKQIGGMYMTDNTNDKNISGEVPSNLSNGSTDLVSNLAAAAASVDKSENSEEKDNFSMVWGAYKRQSAGVISDVKRKEQYLKPSVRKKMKSEAARRKRNKRNRNYGR